MDGLGKDARHAGTEWRGSPKDRSPFFGKPLCDNGGGPVPVRAQPGGALGIQDGVAIPSRALPRFPFVEAQIVKPAGRRDRRPVENSSGRKAADHEPSSLTRWPVVCNAGGGPALVVTVCIVGVAATLAVQTIVNILASFPSGTGSAS